MQNQTQRNDEIHQYVHEIVSFSTEFAQENWSARNIRGPPTCNNTYGDNVTAWCPARYNQDEFVEVRYQQEVFATKFRIFENLNAGSVVRIEALNNNNAYITLWSRDSPQLITHYNVFEPEFPKASFRSKQYKITLRCTAANYYCELDAIELIGTISNIFVPNQTIINDLHTLYSGKIYSDIEVNVKGSITQSHKCILAMRCPKLFNVISQNNNKYDELTLDQFEIILEFLYTDQLNEIKLKLLSEIEKNAYEENQITNNTEATNDGLDNDLKNFETKEEKWKSYINKLIRFSIKYNLQRLEQLLLDYLFNKYFNTDNVLNVLVDAIKGVPYVIDCKSTKLDEIKLEKVELLCMDYIKLHLNEIFGLPKVHYLPREVLIKTIQFAVKP